MAQRKKKYTKTAAARHAAREAEREAKNREPLADESEVAKALEARDIELPEPGSATDLALQRAITQSLKDLAAEERAAEGDTFAALELRDVDSDVLETADTTRLARMVYGLSYIRLLEILASKPPSWQARMEQGRLGMSYIRHAERSDVEWLRLGTRAGDENLDRAYNEVRTEVYRVVERIRERQLQKQQDPPQTINAPTDNAPDEAQ